MDPEEQAPLLSPDLSYVSVFPLICHLRKDVTVNTALSWEQLTASDISFAIVRPLVYKYAKLGNEAVVYACLVVRSHFIHAADQDMAHANVMASRAMMCEILAMKLVRTFASSKLELAAVLTTSWNPISGAPPEVVEEIKASLGGNEKDLDDPTNALEMAIATKSKSFLASAVVQAVVNDIYAGRLVFSAVSNRSLLADNYKPRPVEYYDGRRAPFLDHYRLRVPKYGAILEFLNFVLLMLTFCLCLSQRDFMQLGIWEIVFIVFAFAFLLEEYAQAREHGWGIYIASMWNVFDTGFLLIFLVYFSLRVRGLVRGDAYSSELAFDILSCGACILFPRLAFFAIKNNVVILALRGMVVDFVFFTGVAAVCFSGVAFTLWTLADKTLWPLKKIIWLMIEIWFGNTYLSFSQAEAFHKVFGPILMTMFAALSNTLLLTILISILSNTFARIDQNASQEYLFQFTISTIEGVKLDALFSYQPPFNLLAYVSLLPLSWVLSPRSLHTANVLLIRLTSFPVLVVIGLYERYFESEDSLFAVGKDKAQHIYNSLPRNLKNMPIVEAIVGVRAHTLYDAIFDVDISEEQEFALFEDFSEDDDEPALRSLASRENFRKRQGTRTPSRRRAQSASTTGTPDHLPSPGAPRSPRRGPKEGVPADSRQTGGLVPGLSNLRTPSPLARLFGAPQNTMGPASPISEEALAGVRRIENMLEGIRDLPVHRLKDEMKELQDRQARIENLLLTLTRGMRNETGSHSSRHNSAF
ncbi:receptor-activated Ca2+-permeable cation channel [Fomitiporia mediterranea MF3/22]|uniref:receptor-activated Ca2+-permeable cation channel n=1 Tax=Fomitiporia mediterranea (strain MF3/22) TaxID=694068 RepID=UPI000440951F|nr:receptor-activated Ca2+-permeable cation channel [Fomitiporia mediterranea MF3/22]EJD07018.1 receptor-activated Ca2+-permeable cation channel [Fomitiporia mediterranea MF3/22]